MAFTLPDLPYPHDALEPHIDTRTMQIHHGKHHQGYTNKLNAALEGHDELQGKSIEEILRAIDAVPEAIRGAVQNNGGGYANHSLFWTVMAPAGAAQNAIDGLNGTQLDGRTLTVNEARPRPERGGGGGGGGGGRGGGRW